MAIDVHAHYVPRRALEALEAKAQDYGVSLVADPPACQQCLSFAHGLKIRPFAGFPGLLQSEEERIESFRAVGVERQILSLWPDVFGYGFEAEKAERWHRLLNESLAGVVARHPDQFSMLASGALPDAARAARELERAMKEHGAVGGVVAANMDGVNLGNADLDEYWACAESLGAPVFIHPAQPNPVARTGRFALNAVVHYTYDTTLAAGSLIGSGVLDRFPRLNLILSHGGGTLPYLAGRFDCAHAMMDRKASGDVAKAPPSTYLRRFHYDTVLHSPGALRFLRDAVSADRIVLGSDDPFPIADLDPLRILREAELSEQETRAVVSDNPRRLFKLA